MLCDAGQPGTQPRAFPGPKGAFPPKVLPSTEAGPPGVRCAVRNDSMSQQRMLCLHSEDVEIFFKENSCYLSAQNICVDMRNMEVVWPFGEGANSYFLRGRERTEEAVGWGGVGWGGPGPGPLCPPRGVLLFHRREFCICSMK